MNYCLECPCNCRYLIMDPRTFNVACELGLRISCPVPEHFGGYKHIFDLRNKKAHWLLELLAKIGLVTIENIFVNDPRYLYYSHIVKKKYKSKSNFVSRLIAIIRQ